MKTSDATAVLNYFRQLAEAGAQRAPTAVLTDLASLFAATETGLGSLDGSAPDLPSAQSLGPAVVQQLEIAAKYEGYIARQHVDIARQESHESTRIPAAFDYANVRGLSIEVRQKFMAQPPRRHFQPRAGLCPSSRPCRSGRSTKRSVTARLPSLQKNGGNDEN